MKNVQHNENWPTTDLCVPFLDNHYHNYKSFKTFGVAEVEQESMDAFECIATKLEVREFASQSVPSEIRLKVLEAARLTGTGLNTQHWRFILVDTRENLKR